MTLRVLLICYILSFVTSLSAVGNTTTKILLISKSGQTIYLDKGQFDLIGKDDFGFLVKPTLVKQNKYLYKPVAEIKLVKLYEKESIWMVYKL
ncbi:MAG: hypothetical protein HON90_12740, partial [Halobacteriovoraceae bacterium]|nr:hypothetical protein [Halobacteriovoraceae bacterium]